jgi:CBS domain containing-hemolysin-like protein
MTAAILTLACGGAVLFISRGIRTALPELIRDRGRDTSERRQAALVDLRILWLARFTGLLVSGAGVALLGIELSPGLSLPVWAGIVSLAAGVFLLGEILPSLLARANPERFANLMRFPFVFLKILFHFPALLILGILKERAGEEDDDWLIVPPDVIWLERRREKGTRREVEKEQELMDSILDFSDTIVREVMVPRIDMLCVELQDDLPTVTTKVTRAGHSRIPVFHETIDNIVGILYAKDLLSFMSRPGETFLLKDMLREAYFVPEYKPIDRLFREFQTQRIHIAVVVDEYGGTAGIVTLEDLVEEVFGEILDEYDKETPLIHPIGGGAHRLDARLPIHDLNDLLDTDFADDDYDSLGGMLYNELGKIPRQGETVRLEEWVFTIERVRAQRIVQVRVTRDMESGRG